MDTFEALKDLLSQLQSATPEIVMVVALICLGYALKTIPMVSNRFIPTILLLLAVILYPAIADNGKAPYSMRYPIVRHIMIAVVIWFIQWRVHDLVLKRFLDKYLPQSVNKKGDTKFFPKPKTDTNEPWKNL